MEEQEQEKKQENVEEKFIFRTHPVRNNPGPCDRDGVDQYSTVQCGQPLQVLMNSVESLQVLKNSVLSHFRY